MKWVSTLDYTIPASYGNFGHIPYGRSIIGRIYFDPDNENGCEPFKNNAFLYNNDPDNVMTPIIMVKR